MASGILQADVGRGHEWSSLETISLLSPRSTASYHSIDVTHPDHCDSGKEG